MGIRLEASAFLSSFDPRLVAAARDKVMSSQQPKLELEAFRGPLATGRPDRVIVESPDLLFRPEAIILAEVRPPLLVRDGTFVPPEDPLPEVKAGLDRIVGSKKSMAGLRAAIALAGRIAFLNVPGRGHHGTGWVIRRESPDSIIVVTNRHVAEAFAYADGRGAYAFQTLPNYSEMALEIDFLQEYGNPERKDASVFEVLFMAPPRGPDIALLRVRGPAVQSLSVVQDWAPTVGELRADMPVGVVGYPAYSPDADPSDLNTYFRGIFDVKRIGFGIVRSAAAGDSDFTHDATTLGGNSGSVVFDTDNGALLGLHYGGIAGTANYAVRMSEVMAALHGLEPRSVAVGAPVPAGVQTEAVSDKGRFAGRDGYRPDFLGLGPLPAPLPGPEHTLADAVDDDTGGKTTELKYRHFSIWMSADRLLPLVTAVNIDGMLSKRLGRSDRWVLDHRLPAAAQIDDRGYKTNPLDRGHMVRREDPVWGDLAEAQEANADTFCFTNAAPQHAALNQVDWLRLEEYILSAARVHGLKVSVFTAPVFKDGDPLYRKIVRIPRAFWKIVAIVDDATGALSVTGYVLSQGDLIRDLTQEFVYGDFLTYQVPVALIGEVTGLGVDHLAAHDPLPGLATQEGTGDRRFRIVRGPGDLRL